MEYRVSKGDQGLKLQVFLKHRLGCSVRYVKKLINLNHCRINGKIERFGSTLVRAGDSITFIPQRLAEAPTTLFEDEYILAINKPAGCLSKSKVHRLDRDTSGLLLIAKHDPAPLIQLFKERQVQKRYLAIVDGVPPPTGVVENRLGKRGHFAGQTVWGAHPAGRYAKTSWKRLHHGKDWAALYCYPKTGRTHQIRVHLAGQGHPILGDGQYGKRFRCSYLATRHMLHAESLSFIHPWTQKPLELIAPTPEEFHAFTDC